MRGRLIAVMAGAAVLAVATPCALAQQSGFPQYRQAAADQYPQQPPPGNSGSSGPPSGQPGAGNAHNGGHNGAGGNGHHGKGAAGSGGAVLGASGSSRAPVAVPTKPVPVANGSLPFTGSDLSGVVVLALVLIAAGLFVAAVARATRRRRRHAPA